MTYTHHFSTYEFAFLPNRSATATNDHHIIRVIWEAGYDEAVLELEFDTELNEYFEELDEHWNVREFSEDLIRLADDDDRLNLSRVLFGG